MTAELQSAAFVGVTGADLVCQLAAADAQLGGTWRAWISEDGASAIDRMADVGPWQLLDRTQVFASKAAIDRPAGPAHRHRPDR